jgi:hypothetical protein
MSLDREDPDKKALAVGHNRPPVRLYWAVKRPILKVFSVKSLATNSSVGIDSAVVAIIKPPSTSK